MPDKIVNHFVLADGSIAKYDAGALLNLDDTVSLAGYAPDAKAVGDRLTDLKSELTEKTRNLFDVLKVAGTGIVVSDGVISGTSGSFNTNYYLNTDGIAPFIDFEPNTQYVVSVKAKNDTGEVSTTGLFIAIAYTDSTTAKIKFNNSDTEYVEKYAVSAEGKTISKIAVGYENKSSYMWHLKDFQIEKGTSKTEFIPYISATDYILREKVSDVEDQVTDLGKLKYDSEMLFDFEQGSISGVDGSLVNDPTTIRTIVDSASLGLESFKMACSTGYTYAIRYYNSLDEMIDFVAFTSDEAIYSAPTGTVKIGFCLRYTSNITPSESVNIHIFVSASSAIVQIREDLNSLGNITVSDSLSQILANVIEYNRNHKFANIAFFTDTHSNVNDASFAIDTMDAIMVTKMMNACVHGGDLITTHDLDYNEYVEAMCQNMVYYKNHGDMVFVKGNHDNNHATVLGDNATKYQYHMMMQSHMTDAVFNVNDSCACYYYMDFEHEKVRMIVLDAFTVEGDSSTVRIDDDQLAWLYSTALDVQNGWTVIVFSHQFTDSLTNACNILNAFAHRGTTYGNYTFSNDITTHFVGVIHGHEHYDSSDDSVGFNIIGVTKAYGSDGAIDILTIDTASMKLYETRIGGGSSRTFNFS